MVVHLRKDGVLLLEVHFELLREDLHVEQVLHPQADARGFVCVRRPDTFARRPELRAPEMPLDHTVENAVIRHDQMRIPTDEQPVAHDPLCRQCIDLAEQDFRIDDDAVADHRNGWAEDAARDQTELEDRFACDDCVAGVRSALTADDHACVCGEDVDRSSLALIAPLGADENGQWHRKVTGPAGTGPAGTGSAGTGSEGTG